MKAVIFDLNGTLLDVREGFYWQFQELTRLFDGAPISREMIQATAHGTTEQIIRSLVRNTSVPFDDICKQHAVIRLEAYNRYLKLYEGVDELLPIIKRMGMHVAALTAGNEVTAACLERTAILQHFDVVVTANDLKHAKPHPEGIGLIAERLGIVPEDCIMVGDSVVDILTGRNAGVAKTVGVTHGFAHVDALRAAGASHVIGDIPALLDVIE